MIRFPSTGSLRLGLLGPIVLAGWLALDIGLRLLPVERLGVGPVRAAQRFPGRHSPFRSNISIWVPSGTPGENAVRGNLTPTELRPPLRFSTDELGYRRNPEVSAGAAPDVLFLGGDSFMYGASLSDEETLPAAFSRLTGRAAYNGGRPFETPLTSGDLDYLLSRFTRKPRQVVLVHLEQHRRKASRDDPDRTPGVIQDLRYARYAVDGWWGASPLSNATRRLFREVADDRILPNVYKQAVSSYELPDGQAMLFRSSEMLPAKVPQTAASIEGTAEYIVQRVGQLERRGLETHVLLVPTRFTLYGRWLDRDALRPGVLQAAHDFQALEARLRAHQVRTISGLRVFQQTAAKDLLTGELPFFREDNHWTPNGVIQIARALADSLSAENASNASR